MKRDEYQRAKRLLESFAERPTRKEFYVRVPKTPKVGVAFGTVLGIMYRTGDGENFIHRFQAASRPLIVASPDGKQLYLIGGSYNFTERGIVDAPKRKGSRS